MSEHSFSPAGICHYCAAVVGTAALRSCNHGGSYPMKVLVSSAPRSDSDVVIQSGSAGAGPNTKPGDIIFRLGDGVEVIRLRGDGMVLYKGRAIGRDTEILDGMRELLKLPVRTL